MANLNYEHKEYCSLHKLDIENNFCEAKGGRCRLKNTSIIELPLLLSVKKTISRSKESNK